MTDDDIYLLHLQTLRQDIGDVKTELGKHRTPAGIDGHRPAA